MTSSLVLVSRLPVGSSGNAHALLFAAGQLRRPVPQIILQAHAVKRLLGQLVAHTLAHAADG